MTNKQHTILNMSLLPLAIIIILIVGVGYLLLKGEIKLPKFNQGPQITRVEGYPTQINTDKILEKQRLVITNEQDLTNFLNSIDSTGTLTLKEKINFDKNVVLAVTTGTNDDNTSEIKIRKVYEDKSNKTFLVSVQEDKKGKFCQIDLQKTIAIDIAVISKTDMKIKFEKTVNIQDCKQESTSSTTSTSEPSN